MVSSPNGSSARNGKPISSFRDAWLKACEIAEVEGRFVHDLRRTAARRLVRSGVPECTAMALLGHKTRSIFDRYNITSESDLREAAVKMEVRRASSVTPIDLANSDKKATIDAESSARLQ